MRTAKRKAIAALMSGLALTPGFLLAASPSANVVVYDGVPGEDANPRVIATDTVEGYTTGFGIYDGASVSVSREAVDPATGFTPTDSATVNVALPAPFTQYNFFGNQLEAGRSAAYFGAAGVYDPLRVEVSPVGGTYQSTIRLRFFAPDATTVFHYSLNGGATKTWSGEDIVIADDAVLTYRGENGGNFGTEKVANYTIDMPVCADLDQDGLPDRVELQLKLDPFRPERDLNGNTLDDFDEFIRGTNAFQANQPNALPPGWEDPDGDRWSTYDETLRQTDPNDPGSSPAAPNLQTVEIVGTGLISATAAGATPPPLTPDPAKPFPPLFWVDVVNAAGIPDADPVETNDGTFSFRTSGEQFHLIRARAQDGSGRVLLALQPPAALCIDTSAFCGDAASASDWRDEWKVEYEAKVLQTRNDVPIDARSTAEALLLNRYYELNGDEKYVIAETNHGPNEELVLALRARRNEALLYQQIQVAVTTEMVDLVSDYMRFATSPGRESMMSLLTDHFAGRVVAEESIPDGVRTDNIAPVALQTANFFTALPPSPEEITGVVTIDEFGFLLNDDGTIYRLEKLAEAFVPGTTITVEAIVDVDNCSMNPVPALVTNLVSRGLAPVPPTDDFDNDDMPDDWEFFYFGDLDEDPNEDYDEDGVDNESELNNGSNPVIPSQSIAPGVDGWVIY
jgi:hypothetical protein